MEILIQFMAATVADKAENRREAAEAIISLMKSFNDEVFHRSVLWFIR